MKKILHNDWQDILEPEFESDNYQKLRAFLIQEYRTRQIHPDMYDIFNALALTSCQSVKVVLLGQDPYHGTNQAHGLSFSVKWPTPPPPSLLNIYKELRDDMGIETPEHGDLTTWARRGVLLLNTVLTVRHAEANSHQNRGWEAFTDAVIRSVNAKKEPVAFVFWGRPAQKKESLVTNPIHLILKAPHPSPLSASRGFFGSHPFSKINDFLEQAGREPIDWRLPETAESQM